MIRLIPKLIIAFSLLFLLSGILLAIKPGWKEYKGDGFTYRVPNGWDAINLVPFYQVGTSGTEVLSEASNIDFDEWPPHLPFPGFHAHAVLYRHKKAQGTGIFDRENGFEDLGGLKFKFGNLGIYINPESDNFYYDIYFDKGNYIYQFEKRPIEASNLAERIYYEFISTLVVFSFRQI